MGNAGTTSIKRDGVFFDGSHVRMPDIRDGTSTTIAAGERPPSDRAVFGTWYRGYGQGGDGSADVLLGVLELNGVINPCPANGYHFSPGRPDSLCDLFHFWSLHPGGANFLFADGSVRFLAYSADAVMPALATRAGGEAVTLPD
jgi:prepilin-type processing-associated H-X9-DG protein